MRKGSATAGVHSYHILPGYMIGRELCLRKSEITIRLAENKLLNFSSSNLDREVPQTNLCQEGKFSLQFLSQLRGYLLLLQQNISPSAF